MEWIVVVIAVAVLFNAFSANATALHRRYSAKPPLHVSPMTSYERALFTTPIDTAKFNVAYAVNKYYRITVGKNMDGGVLGEIWFDMNRYSQEYEVPQMVLMGIIARESSFNPEAVNDDTRGIMQVTPGTTQDLHHRYGVSFCTYKPTVDSSIHCGAFYLHLLYNRYHDWKLSIMHYNGGHHMDEYYKTTVEAAEKFVRYSKESL